MAEVQVGTVKWFNNAKGYGFIQRDDGPDVFVHHTDIQMEGYRTLQEGQQVEFVLVDAEKGPRAQNVRPLATPQTTHRLSFPQCASTRYDTKCLVKTRHFFMAIGHDGELHSTESGSPSRTIARRSKNR